MIKREIIILFLILLVSGCATKVQEAYNLSKIDLSNKVSKSILEQKVSPWAKNPDGTANFTVIFTEDTSFSDAIAIIKTYGGHYRNNSKGVPVTSSNWYYSLTLIIDENIILDVANEDNVKWIEEVPSPSEIYDLDPSKKDCMDANIKISNDLKGKLPNWAINEDGTIKIMVSCFSEKLCSNIIESYGGIIYEKHSDKIILVDFPNKSIGKLACDLNIEYIERAPAGFVPNKINPTKKIASNLRGEIPSWAINEDGTIKVSVACYKGTDPKICKGIISSYGNITEEVSERIYMANIANESIYNMVSNEEIVWIERSPGIAIPNTN